MGLHLPTIWIFDTLPFYKIVSQNRPQSSTFFEPGAEKARATCCRRNPDQFNETPELRLPVAAQVHWLRELVFGGKKPVKPATARTSSFKVVQQVQSVEVINIPNLIIA
jgi:hypothetical protein